MLTHGVSHKGTYADRCAYFWNLVEAVVEMRIDRDGAMVLYETLCDNQAVLAKVGRRSRQ